MNWEIDIICGWFQDPQPTHPVQSLITFFLCGWFITGCVWVYRSLFHPFLISPFLDLTRSWSLPFTISSFLDLSFIFVISPFLDLTWSSPFLISAFPDLGLSWCHSFSMSPIFLNPAFSQSHPFSISIVLCRVYWPDTDPAAEGTTQYCNPVVYIFAFWLITTAYIFLGFIYYTYIVYFDNIIYILNILNIYIIYLKPW